MEYYRTFAQYCRDTFGRRLYRVALDAGMTCPNRDGTCGERGCIFCGGGSGDFALSYHGQRLAEEDLPYNHHKAGEGNYIAYFQAYTNTYAPAEKLDELFSAALSDPLFAGISIATRPDCFSDEIYALLARLKREYSDKFIWVELGLQTMHEKTAAYIRRGYPLPVFDACVAKLHELGIDVIVHVILGLPGENEEDVLATVRHLNEIKIEGIKLQLLHYLRGTDLGAAYAEHPQDFHVLSMEEYVHMVCACIGELDPDTVIHRLTGDGNRETLLAPLWSTDKKRVLNTIRHALKISGITQGCRASAHKN